MNQPNYLHRTKKRLSDAGLEWEDAVKLLPSWWSEAFLNNQEGTADTIDMLSRATCLPVRYLTGDEDTINPKEVCQLATKARKERNEARTLVADLHSATESYMSTRIGALLWDWHYDA